MTRTAVVRLAGLLVLVGIGLALLFIFRQDGGRQDAEPLPTGEISVSEEAQELTTLTRKGRDLTYHAVYEVAGAQQTGGSLRIELWRKDGLIRQDQEIRARGQVLRTSGFQLGDRTIACSRQDDNPWQCQGVSPATGAGTPPPDPLIASVVGELANKDVTATDDEVAGRDARCFTIKDATQSSELCITDDGIPVRIAAEQVRMELAELDLEVDDDVFEPPAAPAAQPNS